MRAAAEGTGAGAEAAVASDEAPDTSERSRALKLRVNALRAGSPADASSEPVASSRPHLPRPAGAGGSARSASDAAAGPAAGGARAGAGPGAAATLRSRRKREKILRTRWSCACSSCGSRFRRSISSRSRRTSATCATHVRSAEESARRRASGRNPPCGR